MTETRSGHTPTLLPGGAVLVAGSVRPSSFVDAVKTAELCS
jgi:hypothetical protein